MKRIGVILFLLIESAARGLRTSAVTSVVSSVTIAIALLLVGGFALIVTNMQSLLDHFGSELHISAYLESDLSEDAEWRLAEVATKVPGVQGVELVGKRDALDRFRESMGGAELLEGLDENPLPSSLEIALLPSHRTPEMLEGVAAAISSLEGVEEFSYGQGWIEGYSRATALVRFAAYALGGVLALSAILIVSNTIRLAVYARADELDILDLVGASPIFIRTPFLLEGLLQGAAGGALALVGLWIVHQIAVPRVEFGLELFLGNVTPTFFTTRDAIWLVIGGASLGSLGSLAALLGWRS